MSWFDTSNIVSLAKSTLKEAQKTIDKALDITEEEDSEEQTKKDDGASKVASEPSTPFASSSLWGSFTGSFFEATTPDSSTGHVHSEDTTSTSISKQPNATPSLHESFSLIKQRSHPSSNSGKQKVLSRSFDQPSSKSIDLKSKEKSSRKTGEKSAERTSEKSIESVEKTDEKSVKSDEETSEKGSDKSSEKDGTSSSKKTALEELEKAKEDVGGGVRDEHKSKRKHSTDGDKTKEDEEKGGKECGKGKDNSESKSKEPQDCEQKGKDKRKKDESGDKIETDKSESNDQLEKIHNEDLEKKTKEVDEVESNVSEVSSKSNDMKTDPNPSVADPNSAIDAESNVIDSVRNVKDSLSRNIGDETDAKLPGKAKIDPTQSNLQSKDTETRKDASISQIQESGRKSDVQSTQDETPVKESKGSSQSETVCDKTRDLIANTLPSHGTGKTDDKPYDTKEISTTEEGKHTDTLLDKTTEGFCIAESDGLESSSSVEVAEITPLDVSTSLDQNKMSNLDQIKSMSTLEGKFLDQGESNFEQIAKPLSNSEALSTKESSHPLQSDEPSEYPNKPFSTGEKSISTGEKSVSPPINTSEGNPPSNTAEDKVPLPSHPSPAKPIGSGGEIILRRKATSESEREKKRNDRVSSCSAGGSSSHSASGNDRSGSSNGNGGNRLSSISHDSNRLSSDSTSVELITSPESNDPSRSLSTSSSVARLPQSASLDELTSPSVEIISESSATSDGKQASRSSESVEVIRSGDEKEEEEDSLEVDGDGEGDDSYQSMSESTQTITTAMNLMLKSTSSLETSFSEMASSKENISLSRPLPLHLPLTQYSTQSLTQEKESTNQSLNQEKESANQSLNLEKESSLSNQALTQEKESTLSNQAFTREKENTNQSLNQENVPSNQSFTQEKQSANQSFTQEKQSTLSNQSFTQEKESTNQSFTQEKESTNQSFTQEGVMDGSASTLVASSDDGTFVHIRDLSPVSLERCDLVKIGSGHTSGDEQDTNTTSSSIEIISSPNGDGSSSTTASRQSPAKLLTSSSSRPRRAAPGSRPHIPELMGDSAPPDVRGHERVPSESWSEDTEADKLHKKMTEMSEVLEAREMKLLHLSKEHAELNITNNNLKMQNDNLLRMNEEFTQRLATLEKQYQQVMKEKDTLRRQVEASKHAASTARSDEDKDEIIAQLRTEGAALSRQQLLLTTSVRKLRAAEKENNRTLDTLRAELDSRNSDLERLEKLIQAKEEVERTQIEAVNQLTKTNARLERDVTSLQQQLDSLTSTLVESQKELQNRKTALVEMERRLAESETSVEVKLRQELQAEVNMEVERRHKVERSLEHLRESLLSNEHQHTQREEKLRQENLALLRRLEEAQHRNEELSESMISATKPLAQQIESLSSSHALASEAWEEQERRLNQTINELQSRLSSVKDIERHSKEQTISMSSKISALESKLESEHRDVIRLREQLQTLNEDIEKLNSEKESILRVKEAQITSLTHEAAECRRCCIGLEQQLSVERAALESERRRAVSLQDQMQGYQQVAVTDSRDNSATPPGLLSHSQRSSPLSLGRPGSLSDSVFPPSEDGDHTHSHPTSLNKSVYDSLRQGGSTSLIESLQSQVKLKDTEVQHLQWELSRRELERVSLTDTVTSLSARLEELERAMTGHSELQGQYDALLQMYGEKLEECQELRMDLQDVKEMYKAQIDQLLKKDESG